MFTVNNRYSNHLQVGELDRNNPNKKFTSPLRLHILLGTVSLIAFLSAQSALMAASSGPIEIERDSRMHISRRSPSLALWEALDQAVQAQQQLRGEEMDVDILALHRQAQIQNLNPRSLSEESALSVKQQSAKQVDFSEYVVLQISDAEGAPEPLPVRSKTSYIIPVLSSTVVKPAGRFLKSTAEGSYYAVPYVARAAWWTGKKTVEAIGATISAADDAALYGVDAVRDVHAGRATAGNKGWDAGKKTSAAVGKAFKWFGNTFVEGVESAAPPLWNGVKWAFEESVNNWRAAWHDMREAYLDEVWDYVKSSAKPTAGRVKSSITSIASRASAYMQDKVAKASAFIQDKVASGVAKVKEDLSKLAARVYSGASSTHSYLSTKASSVWAWLTSTTL